MVKNLVLFDKIYNVSSRGNKEDIYLRYFKYLKEHIKGFSDSSIELKKLRKFDKRFEIIISGPEEGFILNLLKKEIGSINEFNEVKVGKEYQGSLVDVGKVGFGLFIDCAILKNDEIQLAAKNIGAGKGNIVGSVTKEGDYLVAHTRDEGMILLEWSIFINKVAWS